MVLVLMRAGERQAVAREGNDLIFVLYNDKARSIEQSPAVGVEFAELTAESMASS